MLHSLAFDETGPQRQQGISLSFLRTLAGAAGWWNPN
jgi:hypothetical protein